MNLSLRKNVESYKTYKNQWYRIFKAGNFNLEDDEKIQWLKENHTQTQEELNTETIETIK